MRGGAFCEPAKRQAGMQAGGREHDAASMAMGARLRERGEDSMVTTGRRKEQSDQHFCILEISLVQQ